ncbi:iron chaperone [Mangrovihabitans endophyticus]|uniref:YdhG-like domain-containing protein n=1 Tax=Mangrovihabitans endophyticus TaxID=1751298 RepID=A0A8J3BX09_9ACTN|nr:DUF1801 domain-containing protein [Mangrovihabitans endophyticus]GGK78558.1 hypothetical protein GCM10012284_10570 [Mangrovihabitans endophyticus]
MASKIESVDDYFKSVPETHRAALEELYQQIKKLYPDATEQISYSRPYFKLDGQPLGGFKAHKRHSALYVWSDTALGRLGDLLKDYDTAESTIRFPPDKPLPKKIVKAVFDERVKEIRGK